MTRSLTLVALATLAALAASAAQATPAKARHHAAAHHAAPSADQPNDHLSPGQIAAADHVLTGVAQCELHQSVSIDPLQGHPGNFRLTFDHRSYIMVPQETTTGAVRLADSAGAVVWIQIPSKSMLLNQKLHQRLVDDCEEAAQRTPA